MGNCFSKSVGNATGDTHLPTLGATPPGARLGGFDKTADNGHRPRSDNPQDEKPTPIEGEALSEGEPTTAGPTSTEPHTVKARGDIREVPDSKPRNGILSVRTDPRMKKATISPETKVVMLELGIQVLETVQGAIFIAQLASSSSSPVGDVLKRITGALGMLKKMVENRIAWIELLAIIDDHQAVFNNQLTQMEAENVVPDPESPLLSPVKQYADALMELAEEIIRESGFERENAPNAIAWEKIKRFTAAYMLTELEKEKIKHYTRRLSEAMNKVKISLELFTSFTVHGIKRGLDSMNAELRVMGEDVKHIRETLGRCLEPRDTINAQSVTRFGGQHDKCLEGTRVDVMDELRCWAQSANDNPHHLFCIGDVAGTGKSTIARTIVSEWEDQPEIVLLSFFFSQEGLRTKTATDFCFSLRDQIKFSGGSYLEEHWKESPSDEFLQERPFDEQWSLLVQRPLGALLKRPKPLKYPYCILVIDALDECTPKHRGLLLEYILGACSSGSFPHIRVLLTTRMEEDLRDRLAQNVHKNIVMHKQLLNSASTAADVAFYVKSRLDRKGIFVSAPSQRSQLIERCAGLFIFASLACNLLEDACAEDEPLEEILHEFTSLDALYHRAIARADKEPRYTRTLLKNVLGIILVAKQPLSVTVISDLLAAPLKWVAPLIKRLGSVLSSGDVDQPVIILHATLTEFLLRQRWFPTTAEKLSNEYAVNKAQSNRIMTQGCLSVLFKGLKPNVCNIDATVESPVSLAVLQGTPASLRYAASAWISHIIAELHVLRILQALRKLLQEKLLNWIELGGLCNILSHYILEFQRLQLAMKQMQCISNETANEDDVHWCSDVLEFLRSNQVLIRNSPLHVYSSALLFTPRENRVYSCFASSYLDSLPRIALGRPELETGELVFARHAWSVSCVAYSSDGNFIISAVSGGDSGRSGCGIAVWDAHTGAQMSLFSLKEARGGCLGASFLPRNKTIISVWEDYRLYKIDREEENPLSPPIYLETDGYMTCVAWMPDWAGLACGTDSGHVHLFSLTGLGMGKSVEAHTERVTNLCFSWDGRKIASTSRDNTLKVWSVNAGQITGPEVVWNHACSIEHCSFSPIDSSLLAFVDGNSVYIYNTATNAVDSEIGGLNAWSTVYSNDGQELVIRERYDGHSIHHLKSSSTSSSKEFKASKLDTSHSGWIQCVAISPIGDHIVTGGSDFTLRIHRLETKEPPNCNQGHRTMVHVVAFTPDGMQLASIDVDGQACLWDVGDGKLVKGPFSTGMEYNDVMALSSDGTTIACCYRHDTIKFWNTSSGKQMGPTLSLEYKDAGRYHTGAMVFSIDNSKLAVAAEDTCSKLGSGKLTLLDINSVEQSNGVSLKAIELELNPFAKRLAYHPSGNFICNGERAWRIASDPPLCLADEGLDTVLKETFPGVIHFEDNSTPTQSISVGFPPRLLFYFPIDLDVRHHIIHGAFVALGAADGRVMVLDFAHLFTPAERRFTENVQRDTSGRPVPSQILCEHSGLAPISIPLVDFTSWDSESDSNSQLDDESDMSP